jgi:hypothetical protein
METKRQSDSPRPQGTHVACPRCSLRYRATIWQVFEDVPGDCPRCLGLHGVQQAMSWVMAPKGRSGPRTPASPRSVPSVEPPRLRRRPGERA